MKKIFFVLFILLPISTFARDSYDLQKGMLYMPNVSVGLENYEVNMINQGDFVFKVTSANKIYPATTSTVPDTFDAVTGILHMPNVSVGSDTYRVNMMHQGNLVFSITSAPKVDLRFPVNLNFNDIGGNSTNKSLLFSLPVGFATPQNYTAQIQHNLKAQGYSLKIGNSSSIESTSSFNFGSIQYGSKIPLQLYKNGKFSDEYTLIFTNLPVIELSANTIVDASKKPGTFQLFSGEFNQATGSLNMGIEFRGGTSQLYPKKSFSLELVKADNPKDELQIKLLNLRGDGDWILDAAYRDTFFVRNLVSHDIYRTMRSFAYTDAIGKGKGQSTIAGQLVEVILNGAYYGVYVLEEKVDRKLLGLKKIKPPTDASGAKLWQQVDFSLPKNNSVLYKTSSNKASLHHIASVKDDFEQKYPKLKNIAHWEPLEDLINFIINTSDNDFISGINNHVDIDSLVDYWILTLVTANTDALTKNYYLARNESDKFFIVPWDYDSTFGIAWHGLKDEHSFRWWGADENNLIRRLSALPATGFNKKVKIRWNALRNSILTRDVLIAGFNSYNKQLHPAGATDESPFKRNLVRWPHSGAQGDTPFTATNQNHDHNHQLDLGEITYIDNWIKDRLEFLDVKIKEQPE